jgi:hypothetical protein
MDPLMSNQPPPQRPPAIKALIDNAKKSELIVKERSFTDRGKGTFSDRVIIV